MPSRYCIDTRNINTLRKILDSKRTHPFKSRGSVITISTRYCWLNEPLIKSHIVTKHILSTIVSDSSFTLNTRPGSIKMATREPRRPTKNIVRFQNNDASTSIMSGHRSRKASSPRTNNYHIIITRHKSSFVFY